MQTYTVHLSDPGRRDAASLEKATLVPEGFAWGALAFGGLWLLWNRLWVAFALYLVVLAVLVGLIIGFQLDPLIAPLLSGLVNLLLGLEGHQIRRLSLERAGQPVVAVVAARNAEEAEARYFADAIGRRPAEPVAATAKSDPGAFLGLFPEGRPRS